jgi:hypothetical protein
MGLGYIGYDLLRDSTRAAANAGGDFAETARTVWYFSLATTWFAGPWLAFEAVGGRWGTAAQAAAWAVLLASVALVLFRRFREFVLGCWGMYIFSVLGYWRGAARLAEWFARFFPSGTDSVESMALSVLLIVVGLACAGVAVVVPSAVSLIVSGRLSAVLDGVPASPPPTRHSGTPSGVRPLPTEPKAILESEGANHIPSATGAQEQAASLEQQRYEAPRWITRAFLISLLGSLGIAASRGWATRSLGEGLSTFLILLLIVLSITLLALTLSQRRSN